MSNITHYELTAIIDSNIPDDKHSEIINRTKELITKNEGQVSSENNLGRKKLSYPIEKLLKGVFIYLEFDLESTKLKSIEKELKLDKDIIRYLTIKKPKNVKPIIAENTKKENNHNNQKTPKTSIKKEETKKITEEVEENVSKEEMESKKVEKEQAEEKKSDLNDLDKKLDEILNDDIIK